jgi:hypothetical protein
MSIKTLAGYKTNIFRVWPWFSMEDDSTENDKLNFVHLTYGDENIRLQVQDCEHMRILFCINLCREVNYNGRQNKTSLSEVWIQLHKEYVNQFVQDEVYEENVVDYINFFKENFKVSPEITNRIWSKTFEEEIMFTEEEQWILRSYEKWIVQDYIRYNKDYVKIEKTVSPKTKNSKPVKEEKLTSKITPTKPQKKQEIDLSVLDLDDEEDEQEESEEEQDEEDQESEQEKDQEDEDQESEQEEDQEQEDVVQEVQKDEEDDDEDEEDEEDDKEEDVVQEEVQKDEQDDDDEDDDQEDAQDEEEEEEDQEEEQVDEPKKEVQQTNKIELLKQKQDVKSVPVKTKSVSIKCSHVTKTGNACKNNAVENGKCKQHINSKSSVKIIEEKKVEEDEQEDEVEEEQEDDDDEDEVEEEQDEDEVEEEQEDAEEDDEEEQEDDEEEEVELDTSKIKKICDQLFTKWDMISPTTIEFTTTPIKYKIYTGETVSVPKDLKCNLTFDGKTLTFSYEKNGTFTTPVKAKNVPQFKDLKTLWNEIVEF